MSWGPLQILLILVIVILLFGTKKLRSLGADLGSAIKSFKKSVKDDDKEAAPTVANKEHAKQQASKEEADK